MQSSPKKHTQRPLWQFLLPPMLLASIGLHGLVLFTPVAPSEDERVPPPDPEEGGIAITKVDAPQPRNVSTAPAATAVQNSAAVNANAAASRAGTSNNRVQSRTQPSSSSARSSTSNRGRRTSSSTGRNASRANAANGENISVLPPTPPIENPNPPAPTVTARDEARRKLQAYADIFATYQGVKLLSAAEAEEQRTLWLSSFTEGEDAATYADLEVEPLNNFEKIPYEPGICLPSPPSAAQILVLVEANGQLNSDMMLVQSTGYRAFNERARSLVKGYDFPDADSPRAYLATVEVEYDPVNCKWPPEGEGLPGAAYFALLKSYGGPEGTTLSDARIARETWLTQLSQAEDLDSFDPEDPDLPELEGFEAEVPYPLNICLPIAPSDANWGVVVNPDGTLKGEPELLRSTGYRTFDEQSKALVEAFDFPETASPQVYVVEVPVDYNPLLCQQLDSEEDFVTADAAATTSTNRPSNAENSDTSSSTGTTTAADPEKQQDLVETGHRNLGNNQFGSINDSPELVAAIVESGWPEGLDQSCFLADLDAEAGLTPADSALDVFLLTRNVDLVRPSLAELYGTDPAEAGEYCGAALYKVDAGEGAQIFTSVVGVGAGNSNALVVVWSSDPR